MRKVNPDNTKVLYGVKEVPNLTIACRHKDVYKTTVFICDVVKKFSFENLGDKIICRIENCLADNTFWTETIFNNLNEMYEEYIVTAETFKRNSETGLDEKFYLLDHYSFDKMQINFNLSAVDGEGYSTPIITLIKELKNERKN